MVVSSACLQGPRREPLFVHYTLFFFFNPAPTPLPTPLDTFEKPSRALCVSGPTPTSSYYLPFELHGAGMGLEKRPSWGAGARRPPPSRLMRCPTVMRACETVAVLYHHMRPPPRDYRRYSLLCGKNMVMRFTVRTVKKHEACRSNIRYVHMGGRGAENLFLSRGFIVSGAVLLGI